MGPHMDNSSMGQLETQVCRHLITEAEEDQVNKPSASKARIHFWKRKYIIKCEKQTGYGIQLRMKLI